MKVKPGLFVMVSVATLAAASGARAACMLGEFTNQNTYSLPGCPTDVKEIVRRGYGCAHWSGEEPYDADRAKEIAAAIQALRCDAYPAEYDGIKQKYKTDAAITQVLIAASPLEE